MRSVSSAAIAFAATITAAPLAAQNEAALRAALEGQVVTVRIDMPATSQGVDVHPTEPMPVDFRQVAQRLKDSGTALRMGQQVMITKVVIKGSHIELQLGGGGYGTFGDWISSPSAATSVSAEETPQERALRDQIRQTTDRERKRQLERELDALRSARQRENARAEAEARQANEAREANLRARRAEAGSRFNIRYRHGMPGEAVTAEGIVRALGQYVEFPAALAALAPASATPEAVATPTSAPPAADARGLAALRKGLTIAEVEKLLGSAVAAGEVQEGAMTVMKRSYALDGMRVSTSFVSGVLIDFAITPA